MAPRLGRAKSAPLKDAGNPRIGNTRVTEDVERRCFASARGDGSHCLERHLPAGSEDRLWPQLGQSLSPLLGGRPVDDEDAVEVVELVLDHACLEALGLDPELFAFQRRRFEGDGGRALDLDDHGRGTERQAALVVRDLLAAGLDHARVDERHEWLLFPRLVDQDAPQDPELSGRQADTARFGHESLHALDEAGDGVVDLLDVVGLHAQNRVGVLAHLGQSKPTPSFTLGVELFGSYLTLDFAHFRGNSNEGEPLFYMRFVAVRGPTIRDHRATRTTATMTARMKPRMPPPTSQPTRSADAIPIAIVMRIPIGSTPGWKSRPSAPTMSPTMIRPMISPSPMRR